MTDLLRVFWSGQETYKSTRYYYNNMRRNDVSSGICVIQLTLRGAVFIRDSKGTRLAERGQALVFKHGETSEYGYPRHATQPYEQQFVAFKGDSSGPFELLRSKTGNVAPIPENSEAESAFRRVHQNHMRGSFKNKYDESKQIYSMLMALLEQADLGTTESDPIARAKEYIENRFHHTMTQAEIAAHVHMSREHLTRSFKKRYGQSPRQYCQSIRFKRAEELLLNTHSPLGDIATRCGYADGNVFARAFKKRNGTSPQQFRSLEDRKWQK